MRFWGFRVWGFRVWGLGVLVVLVFLGFRFRALSVLGFPFGVLYRCYTGFTGVFCHGSARGSRRVPEGFRCGLEG